MGAGPSFQTRFRQTLEDHIFDSILFTEVSFNGFIAVFVDGIDIRPKAKDLGFGIHPAMTRGDDRQVNKTHGANHITPVILIEERMAGAFEFSEILIMADNDNQIAKFGTLLKEADMARMKPVEAAGDHDFFSPGGGIQ